MTSIEPAPRSDFLRIMSERGYMHQCTDLAALDALLLQGRPLTAYVGYDCTADSLHVGHLMSAMMLRWWQKTGNRPITLMGGGTTKVGDPSGKDESRQLLSDAAIEANKELIQKSFSALLTYGDAPTSAVMVDNAQWLDALHYIPLLRDVGRHFSVNRMLTQDSVRLRLERDQPLSFLEFNYMILQAYDFMELNRRYGCVLQMGGSDQWGNIVSGIELTRRTAAAQAAGTATSSSTREPPVFGLTCPLITTASGQKMGKTAAGAVWLSAHRLPVYDYYQFWRNAEDADVGRFLRLFTELPLPEIARLAALGGAEINEAKKILALEATALLHGREAAHAAAETARRTFEDGAVGEDLPTVVVGRDALAAGVPIYELLRQSGLAASNGEGRRLIRGGGARLNDTKVDGEDQTVTLADLEAQGFAKISAGKKRHAIIRVS